VVSASIVAAMQGASCYDRFGLHSSAPSYSQRGILLQDRAGLRGLGRGGPWPWGVSEC